MLLESISLDSMEGDKGENLNNSGTVEVVHFRDYCLLMLV